jgi:hypothetical protein
MAPKEPCPRCRRPLKASAKLVPDLVVVGCNDCRIKRLDGDDRWFEGNGVAPLLKARAEELTQAAYERERWRYFCDAGPDDPIWSSVTYYF